MFFLKNNNRAVLRRKKEGGLNRRAISYILWEPLYNRKKANFLKSELEAEA